MKFFAIVFLAFCCFLLIRQHKSKLDLNSSSSLKSRCFLFFLLGQLPSTLDAEGYLKRILEKVTSAYFVVSGTLKLVLTIYLFFESLVAILLSKTGTGEGTAFTRVTIWYKITKSYLSRSILNDTEDGSVALCVCMPRVSSTKSASLSI